MFIGHFNRKCCSIDPKSPNRHVLITGLSGSGKTCRLNRIELENAKKNATVVVIDLNHTHAEDQIFSHIRYEYLALTNRIYAAKDGLDLCLFQPLKNERGADESVIHLSNSAVQALSSSQNMGVRQIAALREAVGDAIRYRKDFEDDAQALDFCLSMREDAQSKAVRERLWPLLNCGVLRPSKKNIIPGRINILDLSEVDTLTQTSLAELILSSMWRNAHAGCLDHSAPNLVIVLDEFQDLSLKKDAILRTILREGRKFGIHVILATQTLSTFSKDILALLNQSATRLYFRPAQNEAAKIAREITYDDPKGWRKKLRDLRIGESIAIGDLCVGDIHIDRPILLS